MKEDIMNRLIVRKALMDEFTESIDKDTLSKSMFKMLENDFGNIKKDIAEKQFQLLESGRIENNHFYGIYNDQFDKEFCICILNGTATIHR